MAWRIEFTEAALKQLRKLDRPVARAITAFLRERIVARNNPRETGKALKGKLAEYWVYRVGDWRIVCHIDDGTLRVLVVTMAHRGDIYRR